ncbi:hypothetical protein HPB50_006488 [Hyalomma asiaticum]|uniref:Uncharacterized protein n=1 Tax=Hyalomma asiaticum TaxID=266040 RepID=A0ACB7SC17_HYAAI|nr:hypothetical protein HPB50_006488 [Hyalomma asiaticum]
MRQRTDFPDSAAHTHAQFGTQNCVESPSSPPSRGIANYHARMNPSQWTKQPPDWEEVEGRAAAVFVALSSSGRVHRIIAPHPPLTFHSVVHLLVMAFEHPCVLRDSSLASVGPRNNTEETRSPHLRPTHHGELRNRRDRPDGKTERMREAQHMVADAGQ